MSRNKQKSWITKIAISALLILVIIFGGFYIGKESDYREVKEKFLAKKYEDVIYIIDTENLRGYRDSNTLYSESQKVLFREDHDDLWENYPDYKKLTYRELLVVYRRAENLANHGYTDCEKISIDAKRYMDITEDIYETYLSIALSYAEGRIDAQERDSEIRELARKYILTTEEVVDMYNGYLNYIYKRS